jgi:YHS domain-containing protein
VRDEFLKPANQNLASGEPIVMNEEEIKMTSTTVVKDPVCGMDIETATAAGQTEYKGQTYYFCGAKCKEKFDLTPDQYLGQTAGTPKSGPGCCG